MNLTIILFSILLLITGGVYVRGIIRFTLGISKIIPGRNSQLYSVTVLVPARNEAQNIEACVNSLLQQDYPSELYRIVVIDDQSTDGTAEIVRHIAGQHSHLIQLVSVSSKPPGVSPKINALRSGIQQSTGELILTTDADCRVGPHWISSIVKYFEEGVGVVTGATLYDNSNQTPQQLFGIQFLDFLSHTACAAGAIGNGEINNCNGSNMAFRQSAYDQVGGYDSLAHLNSGDDSLLAQKIHSTGAWSIRFAHEQSSDVVTAPAVHWREFFYQRMRWAAQTGDYRLATVLFLASAFVYYSTLTLVFFGSLWNPWLGVLFIAAYAPKLVVDYLILKKFTAMTGTTHLLQYYPLAAAIHIPTILIAVIGGFFGTFHWKGRATERTASH